MSRAGIIESLWRALSQRSYLALETRRVRLLDRLEITSFPALVEPRLQRTVQPQQHVPPLSGHRLYPVGFLSGRSRRTEPNRDRPFGIFLSSGVWLSRPASVWSVSNKERVWLSK